MTTSVKPADALSWFTNTLVTFHAGLGKRDAVADELARSLNPGLKQGPLQATPDAQALAVAETLVKAVARAQADGGDAASVSPDLCSPYSLSPHDCIRVCLASGGDDGVVRPDLSSLHFLLSPLATRSSSARCSTYKYKYWSLPPGALDCLLKH
jgi:hypothetical protein